MNGCIVVLYVAVPHFDKSTVVKHLAFLHCSLLQMFLPRTFFYTLSDYFFRSIPRIRNAEFNSFHT